MCVNSIAVEVNASILPGYAELAAGTGDRPLALSGLQQTQGIEA